MRWRYRRPAKIPPGLSYRTQTSLSPAPGVPTSQRSIAVHAAVGLAALVTYLALRPMAPAASYPTVRIEADTPAVTVDAPATPPGSAADQRPADRDAVTKTGANVRALPSLSGAIVRVLDTGTAVRIVGSKGDWDRVLDRDGQVLGWVHRSILR